MIEGSNGNEPTADVEDRMTAWLDDEDGLVEKPPAPPAPEPEPTGGTTDEGDDPAEPVQPDNGDAGDDPKPDAEQDGDNDNAETLYTVKVSGVEMKVPLAELLAGYSRTADYTQKRQVAAEKERALAEEQEAVRQERALYANTLQRLRQKVEQEVMQEPDWDNLRATDPVEYGVQFAEWSRKRDKIAAVDAEQQRLAQIAQAERETALDKHLAAERDKLYAAMPEWKDATRAEREGEAIRAYGRKVGWTDAELDQAYDHRAIVALNKARLWDELQARKGKTLTASARPATPKTAPAGSVQKPTSQRRKEFDNRRSALKKSGKTDDAARAIEFLLDD